MAANCVISTLFTTSIRTTALATITSSSITVIPQQLSITRIVSSNAAGPLTITSTITQPASTITALQTITSFSTIITSAPLSIITSCPTTSSTTSRTTSSTTSSTPTSTSTSTSISTASVSTITSTQSRSSRTITSTTTVPVSSSSVPSTTGSNSNKSSTPVGAIAGGVVGGVAVLLLVGVLWWWFSSKNSRREREKDFDFTDDAWDPAAGIAATATGAGLAGAAGSKRMSSRRHGGGGGSQSQSHRYANGNGSGGYESYGMAGMGAGGGAAAAAAARDEQTAYYSHAPAPPQQEYLGGGGLAGVGAIRRAPSASLTVNTEDPYDGLDEGQQGAPVDGGWAVASAMHQQGPSSASRQQHQQLHPDPQQRYSDSRTSSGSGSRPRRSPSGARKSPPTIHSFAEQQQQYYQQQQQPQQQYQQYPQGQGQGQYQVPSSIAYVAPQQQQRDDPLLVPPGGNNRFDMASPAPSHMSIPGLAGGWTNPSSSSSSNLQHGGPDPSDGRRGGPLRVTNEEPAALADVDDDEAYDTWRAAAGRGGAYDRDSLTAGLVPGSSRAPTYRTHE
ncbi:hypothetical protein T439DRAFT_323726 [Meredithblackwellia eburnea MCA 4105]